MKKNHFTFLAFFLFACLFSITQNSNSQSNNKKNHNILVNIVEQNPEVSAV